MTDDGTTNNSLELEFLWEAGGYYFRTREECEAHLDATDPGWRERYSEKVKAYVEELRAELKSSDK